MPQPLELIPSESLSHFILSSTLFDTLRLIKQRYTCSTTIACDIANPVAGHIIVALKSPPITLTFLGSNQRLIKIELSFQSVSNDSVPPATELEIGYFLSYKGKSFRRERDRDESVVKLLNRILGPTFAEKSPGILNEKQESMIYPGVSFGVTQVGLESILSRATIMRTIDEESGLDLVTTGLELEENVSKIATGDLKIAYINLDRITRKAESVTLSFHYSVKKVELVIGSTSHESIIAELGPPDGVFYKEDERMEIHSQSESKNEELNSFFMNYYTLGMSLMVCGINSGNLLRKVILHSNLLPEVNFNSFNRLNWRFTQTLIGNHSDFSQITAIINTPPTKTEKKMSLLRAERSIGKSTEIHGFPSMAFEVTDTNHVETIWIF